ncbi:hypothetical protein ACE3MQ_13555 [Paenibacillus lentus]
MNRNEACSPYGIIHKSSDPDQDRLIYFIGRIQQHQTAPVEVSFGIASHF